MKELIIGIVWAREFFMSPDKEIAEIITPPAFISLKQTAAQIFYQFKEDKDSFGIVINDEGIFQGIVTMHDVGEGIFGDIPDQKENHDGYIVQQGDKQWIAEGYLRLSAIRESLSLGWLAEYEKRNITLAGMLKEQLQHSPKMDEQIVINNTTFTITKMFGNKVDKVLIQIP